MTEDPHSPTTAGPEPEPAAAPAAPDGGPEPEPAAATAAPDGGPGAAGVGGPACASERPELLVGAAFAGGFLAALILKRLGR